MKVYGYGILLISVFYYNLFSKLFLVNQLDKWESGCCWFYKNGIVWIWRW